MPAFQIWLIGKVEQPGIVSILKTAECTEMLKRSVMFMCFSNPAPDLHSRYRHDCGCIHDARHFLESAGAARGMNAMQLKCLHVKDPILPD